MTLPLNLKICTKCKWHNEYNAGSADVYYPAHECLHPIVVSKVTGKDGPSCEETRLPGKSCGPDGDNFEQEPEKKSWWRL